MYVFCEFKSISMYTMNRVVVLLLCASIAFACSKESKDTATSNAEATASAETIPSEFIGTFNGVLPCADCEGMETSLTLNANKTFLKAVKYLGKDTKVFMTKGSYEVDGKTGMVTMSPNDGESIPNYRMVAGRMVQLDMSNNIVTGDLSNAYILAKQ